MTDFLITEMTLYPWFTWLVVFFAAMGIGYAAVWAYRVQAAGYAWLGYRRLVWASKAAVRRRLLEDGAFDCPTCAGIAADLLEDPGFLAGDDPPEYQHPDGDDDELPPEPDENWIDELFPLEERRGGLYRDGNGEPYGPEAEAAERLRPSVCDDPECDKYGWVHPPPCLILPTMPVPKYTTGPAMPPQPVRDFLHPAIRADLEAAGFSDHETNEGALDSTFTRAQAMEVLARMRELER